MDMNSPRLGLCVGLATLLLAGCGEPTNETASLTPTSSGADSASAVVQRADAGDSQPDRPTMQAQGERTATVGSMGGSLRLTEHIGAVYSVSIRDGSAYLDGVAMLRGTERGWFNNGIDQVPLTLKNIGIGGSLGKHMVVVTPTGDALWLDDTTQVSLGEANVMLFDGAGDTLTKVGEANLEPYLGPAPFESASKRKALVQERLRAMLRDTKAIQAAWPRN